MDNMYTAEVVKVAFARGWRHGQGHGINLKPSNDALAGSMYALPFEEAWELFCGDYNIKEV